MEFYNIKRDKTTDFIYISPKMSIIYDKSLNRDDMYSSYFDNDVDWIYMSKNKSYMLKNYKTNDYNTFKEIVSAYKDSYLKEVLMNCSIDSNKNNFIEIYYNNEKILVFPYETLIISEYINSDTFLLSTKKSNGSYFIYDNRFLESYKQHLKKKPMVYTNGNHMYIYFMFLFNKFNYIKERNYMFNKYIEYCMVYFLKKYFPKNIPDNIYDKLNSKVEKLYNEYINEIDFIFKEYCSNDNELALEYFLLYMYKIHNYLKTFINQDIKITLKNKENIIHMVRLLSYVQ